MGQFDRQIATALRLIKKNGAVVAWKQLVPGTIDPAQPWKQSEAGSVTFSPSVVLLPRNRVNTAFLQALGKTNIVVGNVYGLMGAVNFTPDTKDYVEFEGKRYKINAIDILAPNGQKILYTIDFDV